MGNVPVIQEATTTLNSVGHLIVGDAKGAGECWVKYADKSVIGSGVVAIHHNIHGNKEACAKAREGCIRASCNIVAISRSIPILHELAVASDSLGDACMGDNQAARNRWSEYTESSICGAGVNSIVQKCHGNHEKAAELIANCGKKALNGVMEVAVVAVTIGTAGAAAPMGVGTAALCTAGATSVASTGAAVGTAAVDGRLKDLTAGEIMGAALNGAAAGALAGSLAAKASAQSAAAAAEAAEATGATGASSSGASAAGSAAAESAGMPPPNPPAAGATAASTAVADIGVWAEYYEAPAQPSVVRAGAPGATAAAAATDLGVWAEYYEPPSNYVPDGGPINPVFDYHLFDQELKAIDNRVTARGNTHQARLEAAQHRRPIHEAQLELRKAARSDAIRRLGAEAAECAEHNAKIAQLERCVAKDLAEIAEMTRVINK